MPDNGSEAHRLRSAVKAAARAQWAHSYLLAGLLPNARLAIYSDSAHGFLFQHHSKFAADVHAFLDEAG